MPPSLISSPSVGTSHALRLSLWWIVGGLFVARGVCAAMSGLATDEAYYALWAQHLAFGYFDHPPMVAWLIAAGQGVFGVNSFGTRAAFLGLSLLLSPLIFDTTLNLGGDRIAARRAVIFANLSVLVGAGSFLATPDTPSVFFYVAGLWALSRRLNGGSGLWWLILGGMAGLGIEAKYTNFFLGVGVLSWLWMDRTRRQELVTPWFWGGAALAIGLMAPNLIWNITHEGASLIKQFGRVGPHTHVHAHPASWLVAVVFMANPFVFGLSLKSFGDWIKAYVTPPFDRRSIGQLHLLAAVSLPLLGYLFIHAFKAQVQGNWAAPVLPVIAIMAALSPPEAFEGWRRFSLMAAAPFGLWLCAIGLIGFTTPTSILKGAYDPTDQVRGWAEFGLKLDRLRQSEGAAFIAAEHYSITGEVRRFTPESVMVLPIYERFRYTDGLNQPDQALIGQRAVIVAYARHRLRLEACFKDIKPLGTYGREPHPNAKTVMALYSGTYVRAGCSIEEPGHDRYDD